jgi:23S rRNA (cytidine1920-2'-O)/16S rRNA (cytidine1409-2'-O)-methyltransferase
VRDPAVHRAVLDEVIDGLLGAGLVVADVMPSPVRGADGNVEFLARAAKQGELVAAATRDAVVAEAHR